jgi:hypothetical protein
MHPRHVALFVLIAALPCLGGEATKSKAPKSTPMKVEVPKVDLSGLGALPTGEGISASRAREDALTPRAAADVQYEVVLVQHARQFTRTADTYAPVGEALQSVALAGDPPHTPRFTTHVRVRATREGRASLDLVVLDPAGDTAMSGEGTLIFRGDKREGDFLIEWDPTARPTGGTYQLLVRVAGRPLGTWPLEVVAGAK